MSDRVWKMSTGGYYTENDLRRQVRRSDVADSKLPIDDLLLRIESDYEDNGQDVTLIEVTEEYWRRRGHQRPGKAPQIDGLSEAVKP